MKRGIVVSLAGAAVLLSAGSPYAQEQPKAECCVGGGPQRMPAGSHIMRSPDGVSTIPFETFANHVVIPVEIEGKGPFRLIFDTGMPMEGIILFAGPRTKDLNLKGMTEVLVAACGPGDEKPVPSKMATGVALGFPGLDLTGQTVLFEPEKSVCGDHHPAEGIIGMALLDSFIVQIDYDRMVVNISEPGRLDSENWGDELPVTRNEMGHVVLACTATFKDGKSTPVRLTLDTGASHNVSFNAGSQPDIRVPKSAVKATIGISMLGKMEGYFGRVQSLRLGRFVLEDVVATFHPEEEERRGPFAAEKEGNLGSGVLSHFIVKYDLPHNRIFVRPSRRFDEPFEFNMAGLELWPTGDGALVIERVMPGSPADESGLAVGDHVTAIDGRPAADIDAGEIRETLIGEGKTLTMSVDRGGDQTEVRLTLRRLI